MKKTSQKIEQISKKIDRIHYVMILIFFLLLTIFTIIAVYDISYMRGSYLEKPKAEIIAILIPCIFALDIIYKIEWRKSISDGVIFGLSLFLLLVQPLFIFFFHNWCVLLLWACLPIILTTLLIVCVYRKSSTEIKHKLTMAALLQILIVLAVLFFNLLMSVAPAI